MSHSCSRTVAPLVALFGLISFGLAVVCRQRAKPAVVDETDLSGLAKRFFESNEEVGTLIFGKNGEVLSFDVNGESLKFVVNNRDAQDEIDPSQSDDAPDSRLRTLISGANLNSGCYWLPPTWVNGNWFPGRWVCP